MVVCTGLHVLPSFPVIPGIQHVLQRNASEPSDSQEANPQPAVYHSSSYHSRDQLAGRRVMILGTGETGMDLAYESVKAGAKEVVLCTRGG